MVSTTRPTEPAIDARSEAQIGRQLTGVTGQNTPVDENLGAIEYLVLFSKLPGLREPTPQRLNWRSDEHSSPTTLGQRSPASIPAFHVVTAVRHPANGGDAGMAAVWAALEAVISVVVFAPLTVPAYTRKA
ncbi:hypothetical protein [Arthrobacter sp.]|uniref:hypothetical protein n=1 Tax=Arthrobacter sp. TaxID=1667 RepID=UPI002589D754|nr:hypothetical protein [Arthrobacter sp.]